MNRMSNWSMTLALALAAGGCVELAGSDSIDFEETEARADTHDAANTSVVIQPGEPEYTASVPSNTPAPTAPVMTDPLVFVSPSFEPGIYIEELLSLYVDVLAFGMILPPLGVGIDQDRPFLQRLCIELGEEEFLCRQRYGD